MSTQKKPTRTKQAAKAPTKNLVSASEKSTAKRATPKKRSTSGTESRQRILNVATQEFSVKGYDGARVDDIMRIAKVSKNLIYHYFGSKEQLFVAVLEAAYLKMLDYHNSWSLDQVQPAQGVSKVIRATFEYWDKSPEFIGLLNSENFHRGKHLRKSKLTREGYSGLVEKLAQLLKQGEKTGEFRPSVDPVELYVSISALAYHYLSNRYTLAYLLDRKLSTEDDKNARILQIESIFLVYLRAGTQSKK